MKEVTTTGKTVDLAIEEACQQLGVSRDTVEFEIIDLPKKGFLGLKSYPAKVRVFVHEDKVATAIQYITSVLDAMGAENYTLTHSMEEENLNVVLKGGDLGFVIGRRGETIDAIQYLTGLVINRMDGDYMRITIDSGNFREKREKTLKSLARRLARNTVKTGRSVTLEPMNPYERRIIHATVSTVEGATSASTGEEPNRRVVISSTNPVKKYNNTYKGKKKPYNNFRPNTNRKPVGNTTQDGTAKPYIFRPNTNTKADVAAHNENRRRSPRPDNRYSEENKPPVQPRSDVPRSAPPKDAEDKPLYAKIDLE